MADDTSTIQGWLATFAEELGGEPPTPEELQGLLDVARHAAHRSQRQAAPIATWIAGRSGRPVAEVLALVAADPRLCEPGEDADASGPEARPAGAEITPGGTVTAPDAAGSPDSGAPADGPAASSDGGVPPAAAPGPPER
jgi:hypothetical protein